MERRPARRYSAARVLTSCHRRRFATYSGGNVPSSPPAAAAEQYSDADLACERVSELLERDGHAGVREREYGEG